MKKTISLLLVVLTVVLMVACSPAIPAGVNTDSAETKGKNVVEMLNQHNYEGIAASFRTDLQNTVNTADWAGIFDPKLAMLGDFTEFKKVSVKTEASPETKETVVLVEMECTYANGSITYSAAFDKDEQLIGFFEKG
ncbi:DUF3887 domain-containing protein [Ruminococcaceae bacterium OttesenSCG-928-A16]|nr:DUF3887 domain-containing protein [Ruminococcaceae bacterium OttesenSCG-928-A16]